MEAYMSPYRPPAVADGRKMCFFVMRGIKDKNLPDEVTPNPADRISIHKPVLFGCDVLINDFLKLSGILKFLDCIVDLA